jgi:hypothetical protein
MLGISQQTLEFARCCQTRGTVGSSHRRIGNLEVALLLRSKSSELRICIRESTSENSHEH